MQLISVCSFYSTHRVPLAQSQVPETFVIICSVTAFKILEYRKCVRL